MDLWCEQTCYLCRETLTNSSGYQNEEEVGNALRDSGVPREQLWLTSKVRRYFVCTLYFPWELTF